MAESVEAYVRAALWREDLCLAAAAALEAAGVASAKNTATAAGGAG